MDQGVVQEDADKQKFRIFLTNARTGDPYLKRQVFIFDLGRHFIHLQLI